MTEKQEVTEESLAEALTELDAEGGFQRLSHQEQAVMLLAKIKRPRCPYTFAHTRHWCGNPGCRAS